MPRLGKKSERKLAQGDDRLIQVARASIQIMDFTVIWVFRGETSQTKAFREGRSKKKWPESKHNRIPAQAMDLTPWPLVYDAPVEDFCYMAGIIMAVAHRLQVPLRWGGDWNMDMSTRNQSLYDWGHFELVERR